MPNLKRNRSNIDKFSLKLKQFYYLFCENFGLDKAFTYFASYFSYKKGSRVKYF